MNKGIVLAAVAGIASSSAAQIVLHFDADVTSANVGDTITWTVSVTGSNNPNHYLQAYDMDIVASAAVATASPFVTSLSLLVGGTPGTPTLSGGINNVTGGQSSILDGANQTFGDVTLGSFTTLATGTGVLSYSALDGGILAATIVRFRVGSDFGAVVNYTLSQQSDSVEIVLIPTPASAALLGLGGLVVARRRR